MSQWSRVPELAQSCSEWVIEAYEDLCYLVPYQLLENFFIWILYLWVSSLLLLALVIGKDTPGKRLTPPFPIVLRLVLVPLFDYALIPLSNLISYLFRRLRDLFIRAADWIVDPVFRPRRTSWMNAERDVYAKYSNLGTCYDEAIVKDCRQQEIIASLQAELQRSQTSQQDMQAEIDDRDAELDDKDAEVAGLQNAIERLESEEAQRVNVRVLKLQAETEYLQSIINRKDHDLFLSRNEYMEELEQRATKAEQNSVQASRDLSFVNSQLETLRSGRIQAELKRTKEENDQLTKSIDRLRESQTGMMKLFRSYRLQEWRHPQQQPRLALPAPHPFAPSAPSVPPTPPSPPTPPASTPHPTSLTASSPPPSRPSPPPVLPAPPAPLPAPPTQSRSTPYGSPLVDTPAPDSAKNTDDEPDLPPVVYNYIITDKAQTQFVWQRNFVNGCKLIDTPSVGLKCGLYALVLSVRKQWPKWPQFDVTEFDPVFEKHFPNDVARNLTDEQLARLVFELGQALGKFVDLGIVQANEHDPAGFVRKIIRAEDHATKDYFTVWIHNDNGEAKGYPYGHWSGLEPLESSISPSTRPGDIILAGAQASAGLSSSSAQQPVHGTGLVRTQPLLLSLVLHKVDDTLPLWLMTFSSPELDSFEIIPAAPDGLSNGCAALLLSAQSQMPDVPVFDADMLEILCRQFFTAQEAQDLTAIQLARILFSLGQIQEPPQFFQLGIFREDQRCQYAAENTNILVVHRAENHSMEEYNTVWIHHDHRAAGSSKCSHWSGLKAIQHVVPFPTSNTPEAIAAVESEGFQASEVIPEQPGHGSSASDAMVNPNSTCEPDDAVSNQSSLTDAQNTVLADTTMMPVAPISDQAMSVSEAPQLPHQEQQIENSTTALPSPSMPTAEDIEIGDAPTDLNASVNLPDTAMTEFMPKPRSPSPDMDIQPTGETLILSGGPVEPLIQDPISIVTDSPFYWLDSQPRDGQGDNILPPSAPEWPEAPGFTASDVGHGEVNMGLSPPLTPNTAQTFTGFPVIDPMSNTLSGQAVSSGQTNFRPGSSNPFQQRENCPPVPVRPSGLSDDTLSSADSEELGGAPEGYGDDDIAISTQPRIPENGPPAIGGAFGTAPIFTTQPLTTAVVGTIFQNPRGQLGVFTPQDRFHALGEEVTGEEERIGTLEDTSDTEMEGRDTKKGYDDQVDYGGNSPDSEKQQDEQTTDSDTDTEMPASTLPPSWVNPPYPVPPVPTQNPPPDTQSPTFTSPAWSGPVFPGPRDQQIPPTRSPRPGTVGGNKSEDGEDEGDGEVGDGDTNSSNSSTYGEDDKSPRTRKAEARDRYDELIKLEKKIDTLDAIIVNTSKRLTHAPQDTRERLTLHLDVAEEKIKAASKELEAYQNLREWSRDDQMGIEFKKPILEDPKWDLIEEIEEEVVQRFQVVLDETTAGLRRDSQDFAAQYGIGASANNTGPASAGTARHGPETGSLARPGTARSGPASSPTFVPTRGLAGLTGIVGNRPTKRNKREETPENLKKNEDINPPEVSNIAPSQHDAANLDDRCPSRNGNDITAQTGAAATATTTQNEDDQSKKRRRDSDSDDNNAAPARPKVRRFHKLPRNHNPTHTVPSRSDVFSRPTVLSKPKSPTTGPPTIYTTSPAQSRPQPPNASGTPLEQAQHRWFRQRQAQSNYAYLTTYIERARQDWDANGQDPELLAPVTAAKELRTEEHDKEVRVMQERTRFGDTVMFPDLQLVDEPDVVISEMKRKIRIRIEKNKKRNKTDTEGQTVK